MTVRPTSTGSIPSVLETRFPPGGALAGRVFDRLVGDIDDEAPMPVGSRIGCWRLGALLGCGGSAMVYRAERADGEFEQHVALKVVRAGRVLIDRFRRERQILAGLRHASIARLIDGGRLDDGRLWLAMELVAGERIDDWVRVRRASVEERLLLFEAVCEAVAYAHERGLVHRDIKPGNLLVDENGRPHLIDFGIATATAGDEDGALAMTPIYASPEQRSGAPITAASDIYQLGSLLRRLIAPDGSACRTLPVTPQDVIANADAIAVQATANDPAQRFVSVASLGFAVATLRVRARVAVLRDARARLAERFGLGAKLGELVQRSRAFVA